MLHPRFRSLLPAAVAALAATALSVGLTPTASAAPEPLKPTVTLRESHVIHRGDAEMGWRSDVSPASAASTSSASASATASATATASASGIGSSGVNGMDVSRWQRTVNWDAWRAKGKSFAYVKATEGTSYTNRYFKAQYGGSRDAGMLHGAYHFASPNGSSGKAQAAYFVKHGGAWKADGKTLPGVLDIEYNPYGSTCYGLSKAAMVRWVTSFTKEYKARTGRDAVIYTTNDWWKRCTGSSKAFNRTNPLWVARYSSSVGTLPGSWPFYTFWQYTASPLDQDHFSSSYARLVSLARG